MVKELKVFFTAMGSIGSRHLKNISALGCEYGIRIIADTYRQTERILPEDISKLIHREIRDIYEVNEIYDIIFITDITSTHFKNIFFLKDRCRHMFIEKPIFENGTYNLNDVRPSNNQIFYVAAPIRFTDTVKYVKEFVGEHEIYAARMICSSYMPNWQKGRDYRKSFRTDQNRGGGVDIDSVHEVDYMVDIFGMPKSVKRVAGKFSDLEMTACDIAVYIFEYEKYVVELHVDYFGRFENRKIELYYDEDVLAADIFEKEVIYQRTGKRISFDKNTDHYYREMKYFLDMILSHDSEKNINTIDKAYNILKLAKGDMEGVQHE